MKTYYPNGILKSEVIPVMDSLKQFTFLEFYPTGLLKSIQSLKNDTVFGQLLSFHENGMLDKKIIVDSNGIASGMAYWFYTNGVLKSIRNYKNDKQEGFGGDYWNKPFGFVKSAFIFNEDGQIVYKMNYDSIGTFINSEGIKPKYWKGD